MTTEPWASVEDAPKHLGVAKDDADRWIESRNLPAHEIGRPGTAALRLAFPRAHRFAQARAA